MYSETASAVRLLRPLVGYLTDNCTLAACPMLLSLAVKDALTDDLEGSLDFYEEEVSKLELRTGSLDHYVDVVDPDQSNNAATILDAGVETSKAGGIAGRLAVIGNDWGRLQELAWLAIQFRRKSHTHEGAHFYPAFKIHSSPC